MTLSHCSGVGGEVQSHVAIKSIRFSSCFSWKQNGKSCSRRNKSLLHMWSEVSEISGYWWPWHSLCRSVGWEVSSTWWISWITESWRFRRMPVVLWGTSFTGSPLMRTKLPWRTWAGFLPSCACWGNLSMLRSKSWWQVSLAGKPAETCNARCFLDTYVDWLEQHRV